MDHYSYNSEKSPLLKLAFEINSLTLIQINELLRNNANTLFTINGSIMEITPERLLLSVAYKTKEPNPAASYSMSGDDLCSINYRFTFYYDSTLNISLLKLNKGDNVECRGAGLNIDKGDFYLKLIEVIKMPIPDTSYRSNNTNCFIATSCYGNINTPEVVLLRQFRDTVLLKTKRGRMAVSIYYLIAPLIARLLNSSKLIKALTRNLLLNPIIYRIQNSRIK